MMAGLLAGAARAAALGMLVLLSLGGAAVAHLVQPAVAEITVLRDRVVIEFDWIIEAPVAGIDLEGVANTNDAEGAELYDALRAMQPRSLEEAFEEAWPDIESRFRALVGDTALDLELDRVAVPEVGDPELPRISEVTLSAALPPGRDGLVFGWEAALGPLVVRDVGVAAGYAAFLQNGRLSDPIPRAGGSGRSVGQAFAETARLGFASVLSPRPDHALFALGLFFLAGATGGLFRQVTAFAAGYTLTLALGVWGLVPVPSDIVWPLVAASLVYVAADTLFARGESPWRALAVFACGLAHGLAFATALPHVGPGTGQLAAGVAGFALGAGGGVLAVIAAGFIAFGWLFSRHGWFFRRVVAPVSAGIALIGTFLFLERSGTVAADGLLAPLAALTGGGMPVVMGAGAALAVMLLVTVAVFATGSDTVRDGGGFAMSLAAFLAAVGAFTALDHWVTGGLVLAWVVALRTQSIGGRDGPA